MAIEDFIRREYGSRTSAKTLKDARRATRATIKSRARASKDKDRPSLQQQRADMQSRRADYKSLIDARVIKDTRSGRDLITGNKISVAVKVSKRMQDLTDRQLDVVGDVLTKRGGEKGKEFFEEQRDKILKRRAKSAKNSGLLGGLGTDLTSRM